MAGARAVRVHPAGGGAARSVAHGSVPVGRPEAMR